MKIPATLKEATTALLNKAGRLEVAPDSDHEDILAQALMEVGKSESFEAGIIVASFLDFLFTGGKWHQTLALAAYHAEAHEDYQFARQLVRSVISQIEMVAALQDVLQS